MKLAIIGSRTLSIETLADFLPDHVTEIVSGGAAGIDSLAAVFAAEHQLKLTVFLPQYEKYHRAAPLKRNEQIADYADRAIAIWDGHSKGTAHAIRQFRNRNKPIRVFLLQPKTE